MSNKFTTQDEISRDAIVSKIDTNLFIEAGAGSGKTTMLVNRMVAMIEAGIPVEKICAITFTKNAALEFYDRFQAKLIDRSNPNNNSEPKRAGDLQKPNDDTRRLCQNALSNIDLCFMGTIDSFCNMILSEHPSEANIPSDARLISNQEASEIYKQFFVDVRNGKYNSYNKDLQQLSNRFSMLFYKPEEAFAKLMGEIMDRRNVQFHFDDNLCVNFFSAFDKVRDDTKKVLNIFNKDTSKIALKLSSSDKRDPHDVYIKANEILQKGWHYNYTGVEKAIKDISTLTYSESPDALGFTNESIIRETAGITSLNVADEENPDALLFKLNNYKYQNSLKLVLMCKDLLEEQMRKDGKFTFFDYLYYLRNMLVEDAGKQGKLIEYIYNRHSYFLIDEFQDTNPMQSEVFFYLTAQDPKKSSWKECIPKQGSLFIVGDPKQSIYRFRSADVASYLGIKEIFNKREVGKVLYLVNNFRSKNVMKTYFNDVFEEVMPDDNNLEQSAYLDIENTNKEEEKEFNGIFTYESYTSSLLKDYPDMEDNKRLALIIKSLVNNKNTQILGSDGNLRPIRYEDFMIIFSAKKGIAPCIKELRDEQIPIRVEGKVLFEECEGLKVIYKIYNAICDRNNAVSLVSALFTPIFGLNDNDLAQYRSNGNNIKLSLDKQYGDSNIEKALTKLSDTAKQIDKLTPSSLYEKIMDDYEIFKYVSSEGLEIVYYVLELIRGEQLNGNIISYEDAIKYMSNLIDGKSDLERCLSLSQENNAVHVANLHKVKGLEAPIVILAQAGTGNKEPSIRIEYSDTSSGTKADGYIISIANEDSFVPTIKTNAYKEKAQAEKTSLGFEEDRLVYVAATRARNVLIVCDPKRSGKNGPCRYGNKWKDLRDKATGDIFEIVGDNPNYIVNTKEVVDANSLYDTKNIEFSNEKTYELKQPSDIQIESKTLDQPFNNQQVIKGETYSTLIGTMVHRLMEMIVMSKDTISKQDAIDNIITEYLIPEFDSYKQTITDKLNNVYDTIHNGGYPQTGKAPQDIRQVIFQADAVYSEIPFTYKDNETIWNGIIDLAYIKDNELHIIDWKTNKDNSNLDEHYKDQLEAYKKAIKQRTGIEVKDALIYHISL